MSRAVGNGLRLQSFIDYGKDCLRKTCKLAQKAEGAPYYRWGRQAVVSALHRYGSVLDEPVKLEPELYHHNQDKPDGCQPVLDPPVIITARQDEGVSSSGAIQLQRNERSPCPAPIPSPILFGSLATIRSRVLSLGLEQKQVQAATRLQALYRGWIWRKRWPVRRCRLQIRLWSSMSLAMIPFQAALWYRLALSGCIAGLRHDDDHRYRVDRQIRFEAGRRLYSFLGRYFTELPDQDRIGIVDQTMALIDQSYDELSVNQTRRRRLQRWGGDPLCVARRKRRLAAVFESLSRPGSCRPDRNRWHRLVWSYWRLKAGLAIALRHAFTKEAVAGRTVADLVWSDPWRDEYDQMTAGVGIGRLRYS